MVIDKYCPIGGKECKNSDCALWNGEKGRCSLAIGTYKTYKEKEIDIDEADSIERLNLSARSFNALNRAGVKKISELENISDRKLLSFRDIGVGSVADIKQALEQFNRGDCR